MANKYSFQLTFTCSKSTQKHQEKVQNIVNFECLSIADFEQVNISCVSTCSSSEVVVRMCSVKKMFQEISQNSEENTGVRVSFFLNFFYFNFIKIETLAQLFSANFAKILRTPFFTEHLGWLLLHLIQSCIQNSAKVVPIMEIVRY